MPLLNLISALCATAFANSTTTPTLPDFDPEMTSREYQTVLKHSVYQNPALQKNQAIENAIASGTRNLLWFKTLNAHRDSAHQLALSSPATEPAHPIDEPMIYNPAIVEAQYNVMHADMPTELSNILFSTAALPEVLPVSDGIYVKWARKLDLLYQTAARWKMMEPYLPALALQKSNDLRGYWQLTHETDLSAELQTFKTLPGEKQKLLRLWLTGACFNNSLSEAKCGQSLETAIASDADLNSWLSRYLPGSEKKWKSFFAIEKERHDISWRKAAPEVASVPFQIPDSDEIRNFVQKNIEDEWQWKGWQLDLHFVAAGSHAPFLKFIAGATPHAQLAGSEIVLDANNSLSDYETDWTIRHEFGHTMGFPDCYIEFYDKAAGEMVNYQLDLNNLMCSRRGKFNQSMYDALAKVYLKK